MEKPPPLPNTPPPLPDSALITNKNDDFDGHLVDETNILTLQPIQNPTINLAKNELCYFEFHVTQIENVTITDRIDYRGPAVKVKIIPGISYRVGSVKINTRKHTESRSTDQGTLFITNKRVFFDGIKSNNTFPYKDLVKYSGFENGFEFEKESGKIYFYEVSKRERKEIEMACRVVDKFLEE